MDTTAAAELGMGELDAVAPSSDQWRDHGDDEFYDDEDDDGVQQIGFGRGRASGGEALQKAARVMSDGNGRGHAPPAASPSFVGSSSGAGAVGRGRGMGSIFYKTKLCSRFRSGNCPYNTNCNFAHGMEELRKPPPGWEEFVASQELPPPPPPPSSQPSGSSDSQVRFHKTRPCKKYFGEGNCPYGEKCNFLHEEQSVPRAVREAREAAAAAAGASGGGVVADSFRGESGVQGTNGNSSKETGGAVVSTPAGSTTSNARPSNWKTRLCNKWETTGHCPFVDRCHFAHGSDELQRYGGGLPDSNAPALSDSRSGGTPSRDSSSHHRHQGGASSARSGSKGSTSWRGPNELSTIYGDWWVEEDDDDDLQCGGTTTSYENTQHDGDVLREAQRRTPLPAPSPKTAPFTRRMNSWEPSRQNPSLINGCSSISQQDGGAHKQAFRYEGMMEGTVLHPEHAWRSELRSNSFRSVLH